jgi:hypothetical protein
MSNGARLIKDYFNEFGRSGNEAVIEVDVSRETSARRLGPYVSRETLRITGCLWRKQASLLA